ncbi:MAG: amidohydrolase family protein, partial [Xanthobacteraceae bacterium]
MRVITLEEHFATPLFLDGPGQDLKKAALKFEGRAMKLIEPLCDIGDKRLAAMGAAGIDFQMLSLTSPGTEQLDSGDAIALARDTNDAVAEAVKKHPKRFGGFAALPTMMPDKAAAELEQRLRSGAFKGAVINGHVRGRYLDDNFFWPILECAEALNAPIHIHPTKPPQPVFDAYYAGFSPLVSDMFGSPGWGWHIETAVHVIRLI